MPYYWLRATKEAMAQPGARQALREEAESACEEAHMDITGPPEELDLNDPDSQFRVFKFPCSPSPTVPSDLGT